MKKKKKKDVVEREFIIPSSLQEDAQEELSNECPTICHPREKPPSEQWSSLRTEAKPA